MLLAGRLKRHTLPVILEFRVEPASLEANLFKLLHFVEEDLDPPFLYIIPREDQSATALSNNSYKVFDDKSFIVYRTSI